MLDVGMQRVDSRESVSDGSTSCSDDGRDRCGDEEKGGGTSSWDLVMLMKEKRRMRREQKEKERKVGAVHLERVVKWEVYQDLPCFTP